MDLAKGVRDFSPREMQARNQVLNAIRYQFGLFGFEPLETPILERISTLTAKMEGSDATDVSAEIFRVEDQGGRDLGLRYDLTVPLSRYVAMHKDLKIPFRRYEIGRVYRDGPIKLGRYREFMQCDADIIGSKSPLADAECINLAASVFASLGISVIIHVNDRKILDAACAKLKIKNPMDVMISLDKLDKIGKAGVAKELQTKKLTKAQIDGLFDIVLVEGTSAGKLAFLEKELGATAIKDLKEVLSFVSANIEVSPSLARGLAYYTGTVFEAFAIDSKVKGSLCGGGRYDNLIADLAKTKTQVPAVGISFGIEPICEVLKEARSEELASDTAVFVIPIGDTIPKCVSLSSDLRKNGVSCAMDISGRSLTKNIEYASKLRIRRVLIVGEKDLAKGVVTIKDLESGESRAVSAADVAALALELQL